MKNTLFLVLVLIFTGNVSFGQKQLTDSTKSIHFVYIVPTSIAGSMPFDFDNFWLEMGYGYKYKKSMYSFGVSTIFHSVPHRASGGLWGGISSVRSEGFSTNVEYKRVFVKRFYCAVQLNYEYLEVIRPETNYLDQWNPEVKTQYRVSRNEVALIPRIGFVFINRNDMSCDINIGTGIRYIWSSNSGKKNLEDNLEKEYFTRKVFDSGQKFAQRLSLQFRVGYAF